MLLQQAKLLRALKNGKHKKSIAHDCLVISSEKFFPENVTLDSSRKFLNHKTFSGSVQNMFWTSSRNVVQNIQKVSDPHQINLCCFQKVSFLFQKKSVAVQKRIGNRLTFSGIHPFRNVYFVATRIRGRLDHFVFSTIKVSTICPILITI